MGLEQKMRLIVGSTKRRSLAVADGFNVESNGYRSQFASSTHPLLRDQGTTVLRRKVVLPLGSGGELSSRIEWRHFVRRVGRGDNKRVTQVGRRPRVSRSLIS